MFHIFLFAHINLAFSLFLFPCRRFLPRLLIFFWFPNYGRLSVYLSPSFTPRHLFAYLPVVTLCSNRMADPSFPCCFLSLLVSSRQRLRYPTVSA